MACPHRSWSRPRRSSAPASSPTPWWPQPRYALRELARRYQDLTEQIARLDRQLDRLVNETAPDLTAKHGVGTHTAAALLVCAGDNPDRLEAEGSFAHLTGSASLDASSGRQLRHRLNTGGNRDANSALHRIVITRMATHEDTKLYVKRRTAEGKTKRDIICCLKRYIAPSSRPSSPTRPSHPVDIHRSICDG